MTHAMTVRLDEETFARLRELESDHPSRTAAVVAAIDIAWAQLREQKLELAYEQAVADCPTYPYESEAEREVMRRRRRVRNNDE